MDLTEQWLKYAATKDVDIRNQLAEYYLPLVKLVCGRLAISLPQHLDKDDLLSSGFFGLLDAIDRFDVTRNVKFETYAGVRIRGAMLDYLRSKDWVPVNVRQKIRKLESAITQLESKFGRPATDEELAAELQMSVDELHELITQSNCATVIPLEEYTEAAVDNTEERLELSDMLARAIDALPEKERLVVTLYYYEELTLKEISQILNLTEARISQLHSKAVMRMRGRLKGGL